MSPELGHILTGLLVGSLSQSSLNTYQRPWRIYGQFLLERLNIQTIQLPITQDFLALFVAYLARRNYASATVLTYVSSIGFVHRIASLPDPTKTDMIKLILRGYSKHNKQLDHRLPITLPILEQIVNAMEHTISSAYQKKLMKAMCTMAFFAALRVGEFTRRAGQPMSHIITLKQVSLEHANGKCVAFTLKMHSFKHHDLGRPIDIKVCTCEPICPVLSLTQFLDVRGTHEGPLFCWPNGTPISREFFINLLQQALVFCGFDTNYFKSHSFRIGAASWAAANGMTDAQIRLFGRWNSNAFIKYIRTRSISTTLQ